MGGLTKTPRASAAPRTTRGRLLLAVAVAGLTLASSPTLAAAPAAPTVMMPTGGGYEVETLDAFGKAAVDRATDATVDLVVVPDQRPARMTPPMRAYPACCVPVVDCATERLAPAGWRSV